MPEAGLHATVSTAFALCCLASIAAGVCSLIYGVVRHRWSAVWIGACICVGLIGVAATSVDIEMNPPITDDASVVGTWTDHHETIVLRSDHAADFTANNKDYRGRWRRSDWNLHLMADNIELVFRFITVGDELRLVTDLPDNHEMWNGDSGLTLRSVDTLPDS